MCRAADAYWNNTETLAAKALLEQGIADLEAAGLTVEAAGHRLLLGRCYWELQRPDLAREQFTRAKDVLETAGPSEALAVAYVRLSGLEVFDSSGDYGLEYAQRATEIARASGSSMALAWSWNFAALGLVYTGRIADAYQYFEDSYAAAAKGGHDFQMRNAIGNAAWIAIHLGYGRIARDWADRYTGVPTDSYSIYLRGLLTLLEGRVEPAIALARTALQGARDSGNDKNVWRSRVLLAHALAEATRPDDAANELPPLSSRVENQDSVYDTAARVHARLAAGDAQGAFQAAHGFDPTRAYLGSPADAISEAAMSEPEWLRSFVERLPNHPVDWQLIRAEVARGRLALAEGRLEDAVRTLGRAVMSFRDEGFLLDAWHASRALGEAQFNAGAREQARTLLEETIAEAESAGALLAGKLARDTAARLGIAVSAQVAMVEPKTHTADVGPTGERMVSVLFADVRGFTEMTGASAPAQLADRIGSLQRWAALEVGRHSGIVDKFAGDAVMATFNVSGQTVDHALQAVKAAVAIIDKAALVDLPVGAGVAVGPAVVGRLATSANVSVLGSVTNLAARLQAEAGAGEVVMSDETHRRVGDWLEAGGYMAERVTLRLKGFDQPVTAFRLEARAGIRA